MTNWELAEIAQSIYDACYLREDRTEVRKACLEVLTSAVRARLCQQAACYLA